MTCLFPPHEQRWCIKSVDPWIINTLNKGLRGLVSNPHGFMVNAGLSRVWGGGYALLAGRIRDEECFSPHPPHARSPRWHGACHPRTMIKNTLPAVIHPAPDAHHPADAGKAGLRRAAPLRKAAFITQLVVNSDADLRRAIGCQHIVEQRVQAYGHALANRPSVTRMHNARHRLDETS
jgi:hypothetical protein